MYITALTPRCQKTWRCRREVPGLERFGKVILQLIMGYEGLSWAISTCNIMQLPHSRMSWWQRRLMPDLSSARHLEACFSPMKNGLILTKVLAKKDMFDQWPFQEPKLEAPTILSGLNFREYPHNSYGHKYGTYLQPEAFGSSILDGKPRWRSMEIHRDSWWIYRAKNVTRPKISPKYGISWCIS